MRRPLRTLALSSPLLLLAPVARAQSPPEPPSNPPSLEVGESAVTVRGAPPGGRFVLFGVAQETEQFLTTIVRREQILTDDDGDGAVIFELGRPVAFTSAWVAVDLASGQAAVAVPEGFPRRELAQAPRTAPATLDRVEVDLLMVDALLIRPWIGAWGRRAGDGGASDADGETNGTIRTALAGMWSVGDSPPVPETLAPGDVLAVIDPHDLGVAVMRLGSQGELETVR